MTRAGTSHPEWSPYKNTSGCVAGHEQKESQQNKENLTLRGLSSPESGLSKALSRCLRESRRQCPPEAGSFARRGRGPGCVYPWSERDGEPWHSPAGSGFPTLHHHELSGHIQHPPCRSCRTWLPRPLAQLRTWAPRTALQTRLCRLEIRFPSWSRDCFFSPHCRWQSPLGAAAVKEYREVHMTSSRALCLTLGFQSSGQQGLPKGPRGGLFWSAIHLCAEGLDIFYFQGQHELWSGMFIESSLFIDIDYLFSKSFQYHHEDLQRSSCCETAPSIHVTFTPHSAEQ